MSRRSIGLLLSVVGLVAGLGWWSDAFRRPSESQAAVGIEALRPRVVVEENNFDFGVLETRQIGRHSFKIRNAGSADLTLELRDTSCKCTLAKFKKSIVAPGESTEIELEWNSEEANEQFVQGAKIETNDPDRRHFDLRIEGRIRSRLGVWPELIQFVDVPRGGERVVPAQLYSQFYRDLKILRVRSSLNGASLRQIDSPAPLPVPFETLGVRNVEIVFRAESKPGPFVGTMTVDYEGTDRAGKVKQESYQLTFGGDVVGDISIHGRNVIGKLVNLGTLQQGQGTTERAYLHFRGDASALKISIAGVHPGFVQARLGEPQPLSPTMTRFPIELQVPADAPAIRMASTAEGLGEVTLRTTHPDYPEVHFQLSLVIVP